MIKLGSPLCQSAPPHGTRTLGRGQRTIGGSGCLLCCFVYVTRALTGVLDLPLLDAHQRILKADGFSGSGLRRHRAARALGMKLRDEDGSEPFDFEVVRAELAAGRPVILGIDYKTGRSSGFSDADHFVVAVRETPDTPPRLHCADPASGATIALQPFQFTYQHAAARFSEMCRLELAT